MVYATGDQEVYLGFRMRADWNPATFLGFVYIAQWFWIWQIKPRRFWIGCGFRDYFRLIVKVVNTAFECYQRKSTMNVISRPVSQQIYPYPPCHPHINQPTILVPSTVAYIKFHYQVLGLERIWIGHSFLYFGLCQMVLNLQTCLFWNFYICSPNNLHNIGQIILASWIGH